MGSPLNLTDCYFEDEHARHRGWAHSEASDAVRPAKDTGARRLHLFHHGPEWSPPELDGTVRGWRRALAERGAALRPTAGAEGVAIMLCGCGV